MHDGRRVHAGRAACGDPPAIHRGVRGARHRARARARRCVVRRLVLCGRRPGASAGGADALCAGARRGQPLRAPARGHPLQARPVGVAAVGGQLCRRRARAGATGRPADELPHHEQRAAAADAAAHCAAGRRVVFARRRRAALVAGVAARGRLHGARGRRLARADAQRAAGGVAPLVRRDGRAVRRPGAPALPQERL